MVGNKDCAPKDHNDGDFGYNHKMRLLGVATGTRNAVVRAKAIEISNCGKTIPDWINQVFEKDRSKIRRREGRVWRPNVRIILTRTIKEILGSDVPDNILDLTIREYKTYLEGEFAKLRVLASDSVPPGVYKIYRVSTSVTFKISVSIVVLKESSNERKSSIYMRASSQDPISESHGLWVPNTGGTFIHTSHNSLVNPTKARTRSALIGHYADGRQTGFWFGTFSTATVDEFIPWTGAVVMERTGMRPSDDANIAAALGRFEPKDFKHVSPKGEAIVQFLKQSVDPSRACVIPSTLLGRSLLGV